VAPLEASVSAQPLRARPARPRLSRLPVSSREPTYRAASPLASASLLTHLPLLCTTASARRTLLPHPGGNQDEAMVSLRPPRGRQSTSTGTQPPWIPGATDSLRSARSPMRSERRTTPGDRQRRPWRSSRSLPVLHIASRGV